MKKVLLLTLFCAGSLNAAGVRHAVKALMTPSTLGVAGSAVVYGGSQYDIKKMWQELEKESKKPESSHAFRPEALECINSTVEKVIYKKPAWVLYVPYIYGAGCMRYGDQLGIIAGRNLGLKKGDPQDLKKEELQAVIGHECGHYTHGDTQRKALFNSTAPAALAGAWKLGRLSGLGKVASATRALALGVGHCLLGVYMRKQHEYQADAAMSKDPKIVRAGAKFLSEMCKEEQEDQEFQMRFAQRDYHGDTFTDKVVKRAMRTFPRSYFSLCNLLSDHPATKKRIKELEIKARELEEK